MAVLIILGNLNQYTFANSIVAASCKANELFEESLAKIEVFHSRESLDTPLAQVRSLVSELPMLSCSLLNWLWSASSPYHFCNWFRLGA